MEINLLIHHTNPQETLNKALAKGLNPHSYMAKSITDPRRLNSDNHRWFSLVVDSDDDYVLLTDWLSEEEAVRRFMEHSDTTFEL